MKKSLLIAILLLPVALAASAPVLPIPECFPCNDTLSLTAAPVLPIPECFPCNDTLSLTAAPVLPIPECFPCNDTLSASLRSELRELPLQDLADLRRRR